MKKYFLLFLLPLTASAEYQVFGVKTDFLLEETQTKYRDVYVNIGTTQGVKIGSMLDVFRVITPVDEVNQRSARNISFKFAKLKVIHADSDSAVARVTQFLPMEKTPISSYTNVVVGDRVDIATK
jgi:hypothetical protein